LIKSRKKKDPENVYGFDRGTRMLSLREQIKNNIDKEKYNREKCMENRIENKTVFSIQLMKKKTGSSENVVGFFILFCI